MIRLTIICPSEMRRDAEHLIAAFGRGPEYIAALGEPFWEDQEGQRFSMASSDWPGSTVETLSRQLQRPDWDAKRLVNMTAANRSREASVLWEPDLLSALPGLRPDAILLICGMSGAELLSAYGLHRSVLSTRKDGSP